MVKTAIITGGTHGIGLAIAKKLAEQGANIIICSRSEDRIKDAISELKKHGVKVTGFAFDATRLDEIDKAIEVIQSEKIDICINNVGGGGRWGKEDPLETDFLVWQEVYNKNVNVAIRFTMAVLPWMLENKWGRVVTITSIYGKQAGGRPWFNMAKAAEMAMMKNLSLNKDFVRSGITFNTVAPGGIYIPDTGWEEMKNRDPEGYEKLLDERYPMGRMGTPEEVANVVSFLCSNEASYVNGACISVDGGESVAY